MALPSWLLVSVGGRRSQRLGSSPTLGSLGPALPWRRKFRVSLRVPPWAHGVLDTPYGEVRDKMSTWPELLSEGQTSFDGGVGAPFKIQEAYMSTPPEHTWQLSFG